MARKHDRYGRNRQFRRNPTRSRKFFPHQLPFLPDFRLMVNDRPLSQYQAANWRDIVRAARDRVERRAGVKRKRDEFEAEVNKNQREINNAFGTFMFGEGQFVRMARARDGENAIRLLMMDEFRL